MSIKRFLDMGNIEEVFVKKVKFLFSKKKKDILFYILMIFLVSFFLNKKIFTSKRDLAKCMEAEKLYEDFLKRDDLKDIKKLKSKILGDRKLLSLYGPKVVQELLYRDNKKEASSYPVTKNSCDSIKHFLEFSNISKTDDIKKAFFLSKKLDNKFISSKKNDRLVYLLNLFRISVLAKKLSKEGEELEALNRLEEDIKNRETIGKNLSLKDYIKDRKRELTKGPS